MDIEQEQEVQYDAYDALLHHIYKETQFNTLDVSRSRQSTYVAAPTGVCLRVESYSFRTYPETEALDSFTTAVRSLNPEVAVKVRTSSVQVALSRSRPDATEVFIDEETRIQIIPSIVDLARAIKGQGAAFIRDERVLVVWSDRVEEIITEVKALEKVLLDVVWTKRFTIVGSERGYGLTGLQTPESLLSRANSAMNLNGPLPPGATSGTSSLRQVEKVDEAVASEKGDGLGPPVPDLERGGPVVRPVRLFAPFYNGLSAGLALYFLGTGIEKLITAWVLDGGFMRFALVVTLPFLFCIALFFCLTLVTNIFFLFGPIAHYHQNSRYYSAVAPKAPKLQPDERERLPHVTIQMPVYKEGLDAVIRPTVDSLQRAMLTYARQGGTSSIFINDDGMQLISEQDRKARQSFYENRGIGWVARPAHNQDGFIRAGRFKKASNMNFCLAVALRMEEILIELADQANKEADQPVTRVSSPLGRPATPAASSPGAGNVTFAVPSRPQERPLHELDQYQLMDRALEMACAETGGKAWGRGASSIKMGEVILIVDSDTQACELQNFVPEDCLRDAAREMAESPEVAIIQHVSDAMQVAHHYFENGIAYFTRRINHAISVACSNGEIAPFVGHNAFLRWSAIQDAAFIDSADGKRKFWSEEHVSEDFDQALRCQLAGYTIRWATYSHGGFKEGVSLTVDDELNRWQKYSFGCSELLFNPFRYWFTRGPVTKQFHKFVWSSVPIHYKISMMAYMFSYYAIASALPLSILNYVALGFQIRVEEFYSHSWELWIACSVVFLVLGNLGFSVMRYRLGEQSFFGCLLENIRWAPFFFFFFGGLSLSLSGSILAHLVSYPITWSSTVKEVERSNFFEEVPRIFKRFYGTFAICFVLIAAMIILSTSLVPRGFHIGAESWSFIFPLALQVGCHLFFPIVLNPWLMIFSY
ncbi:glycosyl transferase family group 2-domain-containing protein [Auriculariales sp. MPI-PUGE-AT-0066]|nr:glycosyl transferase family group 2-domain-containing protein [Auriculariales sp. MPI-PUGE-AT-0066]